MNPFRQYNCFEPMRFSLRTWLIACILTAIVLSGSIWLLRAIRWGIDDAYAQLGAVGMVIEYMESHDGDWPPDWISLRPSFRSGGSFVGGWSFETYQSRVFIDFEANADDLRKQAANSDHATFNVIHAVRGTGVNIGDDPNTRLWNYFRTQHTD